MLHRAHPQLIIVLVCFLFIFSCAAIIRSLLLSTTHESSSETQATIIPDDWGLRDGEHDFNYMGVLEGRMDLEREDYPGTAANNRHDPRTPATV